VKEELKKEEEERRQERADRMLEKERERIERLRRLMVQTPAVDLTGEVVEEENQHLRKSKRGTPILPVGMVPWYGCMHSMPG
jgi:hypothetical protein